MGSRVFENMKYVLSSGTPLSTGPGHE